MATKVKRARAKKTASKKSSSARPGARRQPETLRLRKIAPSFTATDLQRSIAFYRDVLGFVIGEEWRQDGALAGCEIHAGSVTFMLGQDDFAKGRDRQKGLGTRVWCHTAQDLDRLAAEITARGGILDQEPQDMSWGDRVFMITDPDGFHLTFVQER
ncbi:MAG TPA: VOC family protein [Gemmatimonadales bacterium]|nr:VOC family protein [Gemmatimonadales bacterium]